MHHRYTLEQGVVKVFTPGRVLASNAGCSLPWEEIIGLAQTSRDADTFIKRVNRYCEPPPKQKIAKTTVDRLKPMRGKKGYAFEEPGS